MSKVLVIIPAFNEEQNIERVIERLIKEAPKADYVIVNDGSTDNTAAICLKNKYNLLNLPVNLGLAGAFQAGMRYAKRCGYDAAVQFDGDGQHRPEYIMPMYDKLCEGYNIVIASRFADCKKPMSMRMIGSNLIELAIRITSGVKISDPTSGMRMYDKKMIHEFATELNYAPEPDTISYLAKQGAKIAEIQTTMDERIAGVSYLTPITAIKYMLRILISICIIQNFRKKRKYNG